MTEIKNTVTDFYPIDVAFGAHIVKALDAYSGVGAPNLVQKYLQRPANQKVYRAEYDSPKSFLMALKQYQKQQRIQDASRLNGANLPLIYYYRTLEFRTAPPEYAVFVMNQLGWDDALLEKAQIAINYFELTYRVMFLANDKASIEHLILAWHMFIAQKKIGHHRMDVPFGLQGGEVTVPVVIEDAQTLESNNLSHPYGDGRLFAVDTQYSVHAPVMYGHDVQHISPIRWQLDFVQLDRAFC